MYWLDSEVQDYIIHLDAKYSEDKKVTMNVLLVSHLESLETEV